MAEDFLDDSFRPFIERRKGRFQHAFAFVLSVLVAVLVPQGRLKHGVSGKPDVFLGAGLFRIASRPGQGEEHFFPWDVSLGEFVEEQHAGLEVVYRAGGRLDEDVSVRGDGGGRVTGPSGGVQDDGIEGRAHVQAAPDGLFRRPVGIDRRQRLPAVVDAALVPFQAGILLRVEVGQPDPVGFSGEGYGGGAGQSRFRDPAFLADESDNERCGHNFLMFIDFLQYISR